MPFLVTAKVPQAEVTHYEVTLDGAINRVTPEIADGQARLHLDVTGVSMGQHTVSIAACNEWGCTPASDPFVFTKALPSVPSGIGLEV